MREIIKELIEQSILFEYKLPNIEKNIEQSKYSTVQDVCYSNKRYEQVAELIYNSIIDYAKNQYEIDYENLNKEQLRTIINKIRYDEDASFDTKKKYGFFGEILLYCILEYFFGTDVLIAKGHFYNILEGAEPKGYDSFHIIQRNERLELWFGEAKCYDSYRRAIDDVLNKIENAMSDKYLSKNLLSIIDKKQNLNNKNPMILQLCREWEENPEVDLIQNINKYKMKLIYPILIVADIKNKEYDNYIKECIDYIEEKFNSKNPKFTNSFEYDIFFMFLPIKGVKDMKEQVIKWISEKKQLK